MPFVSDVFELLRLDLLTGSAISLDTHVPDRSVSVEHLHSILVAV